MKKPGTRNKVVKKTLTKTDPTSPPKFRKRELDCVKYLLEYKTNSEIAAALDLSLRTIEFYINNMKVRLSCYSKKALIAKLHELNKTLLIPDN